MTTRLEKAKTLVDYGKLNDKAIVESIRKEYKPDADPRTFAQYMGYKDPMQFEGKADYIGEDKRNFVQKFIDKRSFEKATAPATKGVYIFGDPKEKLQNKYSIEQKNFVNAFKDTSLSDVLPYINSAGSLAENLTLADVSARVLAGNPEAGDEELLQSYARYNDLDPTFGYNVAKGIMVLPSFMIEFWSSGGVATVIKNKIGKKLAKEATEEVIKKGIASKIKSGVTTSLIQASIMPIMVSDKVVERMLPGVSVDDANNLYFNDGEDFMPALYKGYGDTAIEFASERAGDAFMPLGSWISKNFNKVGQSALLKLGIAKSFAKVNNVSIGKATEIAKRFGFNGIIGELGEERVGEAARAVFGIEEYKLPTWEQIFTELAIFAVPGTSVGLMNLGLRKIGDKKVNNIDIDPNTITISDKDADNVELLKRNGMNKEDIAELYRNVSQAKRDEFVGRVEAKETEETLQAFDMQKQTMKEQVVQAGYEAEKADVMVETYSKLIEGYAQRIGMTKTDAFKAILTNIQKGDVAGTGELMQQTDPLIAEALKYDSAEEFINSYGLYHGTPAEIEGGSLKFGAGSQLKKGGYMGGHFLSDTESIADVFSFGGKVYRASSEIKNKTLDVNKNKNLFKNMIGKEYESDGEMIEFTQQGYDAMFPNGKADWSTIDLDLVQQVAKKENKVGIAIPEYAGGKEGMTYQLFEDEIPIYTRQQLTDIYNEAHSLKQRKGFTEAMLQNELAGDLGTIIEAFNLPENTKLAKYDEALEKMNEGYEVRRIEFDILNDQYEGDLDLLSEPLTVEEMRDMEDYVIYPKASLKQKSKKIDQASYTRLADGTALIKLFEAKNDTSLMHEFAHQFFDVVNMLSPELLAPVLKEAGVANIDTEANYTKAQEYFARSYEAYHRKGEAPTPELKSLFEKLRDWIRDVYKNLSDMKVQLTPTMEQFFNEMYAGEDKATTQAEVKAQQEGDKVSKLSRRGADGLETAYGITIDDADLVKYHSLINQEQIDRAMVEYEKDPVRALNIALGNEKSNDGILETAYLVVAEIMTRKTKDIEAYQMLATQSSLAKEASMMGQFIQMLSNIDKDSPMRAVQEVAKTRVEAYNKVGKVKADVVISKESKKLKETVDKSFDSLDKEIDNFIKELEC